MQKLLLKTETHQSRIQQAGISLGEYSLVGGLLVAIAIAGFTLLGNNLQGLFTSLLSDLKSKPIALAQAKQNPVVHATTPTPNSIQKGSTEITNSPSSKQEGYYSQLQTVCFKNKCLQIPEIEPGPVAHTNGALGGELVASLADVFKQIADDLQREKDTDPALVNLITALANQGHSIADAQRALVTQCPTQECNGNVKMFDKAIGSVSVKPVDTLVKAIHKANDTFETSFVALQDYLAQNPTSLSPAYAALISQESRLISNIADSIQLTNVSISPVPISLPSTNTSQTIPTTSTITENLTPTDTSSASGTLSVFSQTTGWSINESANITEQSANTICQSGGYTTRCTVKQTDGEIRVLSQYGSVQISKEGNVQVSSDLLDVRVGRGF